jgi:predicted membrane GTPase involved in stress response
MELLSPAPKGRITWEVPGWVDVEVVVEEVLVVLVVVDEDAVVDFVVDDEEGVVVAIEVELVKVLVVEEVDAEVLVVEEVDAEVLELVDLLDAADEDVEVPVWVLWRSVVVEEGWKSTLVAKAPARRTRVMPAISTTVPNGRARPGDFLPGILSLVPARGRTFSACR